MITQRIRATTLETAMPLWNITNIVRFEYFIDAENASEAIKECMDSEPEETNESWHAVEIDIEEDDDEEFDDDDGFDDDDEDEDYEGRQ